jgi:asparagine synthetase B (glutamine-hydrolysing)
MAARSPYRGALRTLHLPRLSIGIQARGDECTLHQEQHLTVACHGRVYDPSEPATPAAMAASAERVARAWIDEDTRCLTRLDGEFSLLIHDRRNGTIRACVSLSMTRFLYWTRQRDLLVLASEVRQVAVGAGIPQRLDLEQVAQSICVFGPAFDLERTEYVGINRLTAPTLYECRVHQGLHRGDVYWTPPATERLIDGQAAELPAELLGVLAAGIDRLPPYTGFSLSGGYDSGTLWITANRPEAARRNDIRAHSLITPDSAADETTVIKKLLDQTGTTATLIDMRGVKASDVADAHARFVDRLPAVPTLHALDIAGEHLQSDGVTQAVTGVGAEASASAGPHYAIDLFRSGHWVTLIKDALRFRSYTNPPPTRYGRALNFLKLTAFPPGSPLQRVRRTMTSAPDWLAPRWHDLWRSAVSAREALDVRQGFARSRVMQFLRLTSIVGGWERVEQLNERYGIESFAPFLHRAVVDFALRTPARAINGGQHPKHLLRCAARQALGTDPPWPYQKVLPTAVFEHDVDLVLALGPTDTWSLVQHELVTRTYAGKMLREARQDGLVTLQAAVCAAAERHLRYAGR